MEKENKQSLYVVRLTKDEINHILIDIRDGKEKLLKKIEKLEPNGEISKSSTKRAFASAYKRAAERAKKIETLLINAELQECTTTKED